MTLASFGWGTWWVLLLVEKLFGLRPDSLVVPGFISSAFAVAGLAVAVWCFRARRSWMMFVMVPLFANLSLFFVPWLAEELAGRRG